MSEAEDRVDALAGELCETSGETVGPPPAIDSLDADQRLRLADLQLLDALLLEAYGRTRELIEIRVANTIERIATGSSGATEDDPSVSDEETEPLVFDGSRTRRPTKLFALAAAILLVVVLPWLLARAPASTAYAAVGRAYRSSLEATDREYRVTIDRRGPLGRKHVSTARLFVRGGERFALSHPAPLPGVFWLGSDDEEHWLVPAVGPVLTSHDRSWLPRWLAKQNASLPYLEITSILKRLDNRYALEIAGQETLEDRREAWQKVHGTRRQGQDGPAEIDLWISPTTGMAGKIVLTWKEPSAMVGIDRMTFDFVSNRSLPDSWYGHSAHHARAVPAFEVPSRPGR